MPTLLDDVADETSASYRRLADRLDQQPPPADAPRPSDADLARFAAGHAAAQLPAADALWVAALRSLAGLTPDAAVARLRRLADLLDAGHRLCQSAARQLADAGLPADAPLDHATGRFAALARQARGAIDHRVNGWQPADPERLAEGLRQARAGQVMSADEARRWFRRGG